MKMGGQSVVDRLGVVGQQHDGHFGEAILGLKSAYPIYRDRIQEAVSGP